MVACCSGGGIPITYELSNSPWGHTLPGEIPASSHLPVGRRDPGMLTYELKSMGLEEAARNGHEDVGDLVVLTAFDARHGRAADAPDGLFMVRETWGRFVKPLVDLVLHARGRRSFIYY